MTILPFQITAICLCMLLIFGAAAPVPDPAQHHQQATEKAEREARVIIFRPLFVYRQQELQHLHYLQEHKQQLESTASQQASPLGLMAFNFV